MPYCRRQIPAVRGSGEVVESIMATPQGQIVFDDPTTGRDDRSSAFFFVGSKDYDIRVSARTPAGEAVTFLLDREEMEGLIRKIQNELVYSRLMTREKNTKVNAQEVWGIVQEKVRDK